MKPWEFSPKVRARESDDLASKYVSTLQNSNILRMKIGTMNPETPLSVILREEEVKFLVISALASALPPCENDLRTMTLIRISMGRTSHAFPVGKRRKPAPEAKSQ